MTGDVGNPEIVRNRREHGKRDKDGSQTSVTVHGFMFCAVETSNLS